MMKEMAEKKNFLDHNRQQQRCGKIVEKMDKYKEGDGTRGRTLIRRSDLLQ